MKKLINKIRNFCNQKAIAAKTAIQSVTGEGYVDTGVKIIISVVVGGVILAGLYALFKTPFFPISTPRSARCSIIPAPDPETVRR